MKSSVAAATVLAGLGCTQAVRREDTRLFSMPPQPTPNESTPTNIFTILPVSSFPGSETQSSETPSSPSMSHVTPDPTISSIHPPVTSGNVTAPASPVPTSSSAPGPSASASASPSGTHSGTSTSTLISTTSIPAAAPTPFESNLVAGVVALAALAVAI